MEEEVVVGGKELNDALDNDIRATLKDIQSRTSEDEPEKEPAKAPEKVVAAPEVPAKAERPRDEEGKFVEAPKEPKKSAAPAKADTPEPTAAAASEQAAAAVDESLKFGDVVVDLNRPPSSWKPAGKAIWASLPEVARQEIYRRETNYGNDLRGIRDNANFGQSVRQVVEPYRMIIEAEGGTPERAIADTMKTAALFRIGTPEQKLNAIFAIDKQFNAGLMGYLQKAVEGEVARRTGQPAPAQQQPQQPVQDPRVDQLLSSMEQEKRERASENEKVTNAAVQRFMDTKDASGQPQYPFIDNVIEDLSARIAQMRKANPALPHEEILKLSYEAAVWANPETRAVLIGQQQAAASRPAEQLRKVEQAKRANAGNMPKRGAIPAATVTPVLRLGTAESDESIRDTYRQLTANN